MTKSRRSEMDKNFNHKIKKSEEKDVETIAGFIASALDMEDKMSESVYGEFLKREIWPAGLGDEEFRAIKEFLTILMQETEAHKKAFLNLQKNGGKE